MPEYYEIRIKGRLDQRWSEWFAGLKVTYLETDETLLSGVLPDQSAFFGLLERIRDLNLVLLSVNRRDPESAGGSTLSIEKESIGTMPSLNSLVKDFLAEKRIAVVGISEKRDSGCNLAYDTFKKRGYQVSAVNPHQASFHGDTCYPDLKSIPDKPGAVFILANPAVSEQIVEQCIDLGIKQVWMHCFMGTRPGLVKDMTSVSQKAVDLCRENGIAVIPGACPNQFLNSDPGHSLMRVIFGLLGFHRITA